MNYSLRGHYERFDTGYLCDLVKTDLTEEARAILNQVLLARGMSQSELEGARAQGKAEEQIQRAEEEHLAPRMGRLAAFAVDFWGCMLLGYLVCYPLLRPFSEALHANVVVLVWVGYFLSKDWIPGGSIGKRLLGFKVVQADTEKPCTWWQSFVRNIAMLLQILDWLPIIGKRRMRFGDMVAGTEVVRRVRLAGPR